MTNSHPAKVKTERLKILASGIDSLVLSLDVSWQGAELFQYLDEIKEKAKEQGIDYQGQLKKRKGHAEIWPFTIKPHGTKGYSWILIGSDFAYKIGNWTDPGSRPGVMIEIRSETLWRLGPDEAIRIALGVIEANGGYVVQTKLSRADLCVDVLFPETEWSYSLMDHCVKRAADHEPHYRHSILTGFSIGRGVIMSRIYDKPLEIKSKSKKEWMFIIWVIDEVPKGYKIIRVEFQLRREVLKELGLNTPNDLLRKAGNAWAYCTQKWLKFQDRPGMHHTQRTTLPWWKDIQDGFQGIQNAAPLIREKVVSIDKRRLMQQANGIIIALHAITQEEENQDHEKQVDFQDCVRSYEQEVDKHRDEFSDIQDRLKRKRSKYHRISPAGSNDGEYIYRLNKDLTAK